MSLVVLVALAMTMSAQESRVTANNDDSFVTTSLAVEANDAKSQTFEWNQWRGPDRDGSAKGLKWPAKIDESTLAKKWSIPLGPSYSGPLVVGDRVYVTESRDRQFEVVKALSLRNGEEIWESQWNGSMTVPFFAAANGNWIRSTPAYADGMLYVAGMRDVLVCLNASDGAEVWKRNFPEEMGTPLPTFGFVCSPLIDGDHLYVQAAGAFLKLNRKTGETVWEGLKDGGGMSGSAFSSPIIATIAGKKQAVVLTRNELCGVDLADGRKLWGQNIKAFRGMNILTPTIVNDEIFTSTYGGTTQLFKVSPTGGSGELAINEKWNLPVQGYMSTPVVVDDHAYVHLRNQRFACFDLKNGVEKWRSKPYGKYASLVAADGKILALDQRGQLLMIEANPNEFKVLDSRQVGDDSWAHVAVTRENVVVRNLKDVSVFEWTATGVEGGQ